MSLSISVSSAVQTAPQAEELQNIEPESTKPLERQSRAMYFTKPPSTTTASQKPLPTSTETNNQTKPPAEIDDKEKLKTVINIENNQSREEIEIPEVVTDVTPVISFNATEISHPSVAIEANKTVTNTTTLAAANKTAVNMTTETKNITSNESASTISKKRNNFTKPTEIKDIDNTVDGVAESRIVTEKPLSLETSFLQTRIPPSIESSRRIVDQSSEGFRMDAGAIAGVSFAGLVVVALVGSTAFVLYRRRYLNKPQTLNDKCSNPDSSGYLDDSTIRVSNLLFCEKFFLLS